MSGGMERKEPSVDNANALTLKSAHAATFSGMENRFQPFSTLPDEITTNILDRLDVLSKIRCRRVCKKWSSYLREDGCLMELVKLDEKSAMEFCASRPKYFPGRNLLEKLGELHVWEKVRHLVFEGMCNVFNKEIHACRVPQLSSDLLAKLMIFMQDGRHQGDFQDLKTFVIFMQDGRHQGDFQDLKTCQMRRTAVYSFNFQLPTLPKCRYIITDGSFVIFLCDRSDVQYEHMDHAKYCIEFEVRGSRRFDLSGAVVQTAESLPPWLGCIPLPLPVEIVEFIKEQCEEVSDEAISRLGEVYSILLKGRRGMIIRRDVGALFNDICYDGVEPKEGYDPTRPHWQQCKNYDFNNVDKLRKYALVYYSKPLKCYHLVTAQPVQKVLEWTSL